MLRLLRVRISKKEIQFIYNSLARLSNSVDNLEGRLKSLETPKSMLNTYAVLGIFCIIMGFVFALKFSDVKEIQFIGAGYVPMSTIVVLYFQFAAVFAAITFKQARVALPIFILIISTAWVAYMGSKQEGKAEEPMKENGELISEDYDVSKAVESLKKDIEELRSFCCPAPLERNSN